VFTSIFYEELKIIFDSLNEDNKYVMLSIYWRISLEFWRISE
jgi:hypothetical protein